MARRLIGLDIGTNAIAVAEIVLGDPPRLTAFGQVALPRDAMREGEVAQDAAVTEAIKRLRGEVGLRKSPVRVGIASPRLIVRQIDMPVMSRADLAGALRFQIQDLIPIPVDEAVVDFAILDEYIPEAAQGADNDGEPVMRVLLAAAQKSMVLRLVEAVEAAGLPVESVGLIPLALVRSLATTSDHDGGAEGIVSIGGGVTSVVVHEGGIPRFVRVLGSGGRLLTEAIATSLDASFDQAESLKRQIGLVDDDAVSQARAATERPFGALLDEIRSSLDYYRNQPGAARLGRVQLTGGGALMAGVQDRLGALLGVPIERAMPRQRLQVDDIGFSIDDLPRLDPYMSAAVGLALGDSERTAIINLLPDYDPKTSSSWASRRTLIGAAAAGVLLAGLAVPTIARHNDASKLNEAASAVETKNAATQTKIDGLQRQAATQEQLKVLTAQVDAVLVSDVSWASMLNELARTMPNSVWLTGFQGSVTGSGALAAAGPSVGASPRAGGANAAAVTSLQGTVSFTATGLDFVSIADWLKRVSQMPSYANLWIPQAQKSQLGNRDVVTFQSTADLTDKARSKRNDDSGGRR